MSAERRDPRVWQNLFLVRHGESTANEVNRFAGAIDAPLTDLGRAQARRAGHGWKDGRIDLLFVSPLLRARETADILLETLSPTRPSAHPEVRYDERLSERHFGEFTLQNKTRLQRRFGIRGYEASLYRSDAELHGGEPFTDFHQRVLDFLRLELYPALKAGRRVLIVAHKYVIELLSRLILRLPEACGYDLRLPNARVLAGSELDRYVHGESHLRNLLSDWVVVHHSRVLAAAAGLGLLVNSLGVSLTVPAGLLFSLLLIATTISLARISLKHPVARHDRSFVPINRLIVRFVMLPWAVISLGLLLWPDAGNDGASVLLAVALLLAAPTAITALTLSRSSGGLVLPSVYIIVLSTAMSLATTVGLLWFFGFSNLTSDAFVYISLSTLGLVVPLLLVSVLRRHFPISTAKAAEDHASTAVLALGAFVLCAFLSIELSSFYPHGITAIVLGVALRLVAVRLARYDSVFSLDDYFSMSYPNIFLVIILAGLLGNGTIMELATWFLVPMFVMAPIDDILTRDLQHLQPRSPLMSYLQIQYVPSAPAFSIAQPRSMDSAGLQPGVVSKELSFEVDADQARHGLS